MRYLVVPFLFFSLSVQAGMVANQDFSEGREGWNLFVPGGSKEAGCKWDVLPGQGKDGAAALSMTSAAEARYAALSSRAGVEAGKVYRFSILVKAERGAEMAARSAGVLARMTFFSKDGKDLGAEHIHFGRGGRAALASSINQTYSESLPADWEEIAGVFAAPADAATVQVALFCWSMKGGVLWSRLQIEPAPGGSAPTPLLQAAASRSPGASQPAPVSAVPSASVPAVPELPAWAATHPRIVWDAARLEETRRRIRDHPEAAAMWRSVEALCDSYCDPAQSRFLKADEAYGDFLALQGGSHENRAKLEVALRRWLTPLDLLSFAYVVSGREEYGKKAVELAEAAANRITPDKMEAGFFYTRTFPARSLALAYDWCYPLFSPGQRAALREAIAQHASMLYLGSLGGVWGQSTLGRIWNWNVGTASAWGLAALAIDGESNFPTRQWLFQAARNVEDYLRFAIDPAGGIVEGPVYFGYGGGYLPYFVEGLKRRTGEDLYLATNYHKVTGWLPFEVLPGGGRVNNIMDSGFRISTGDALIYALHRDSDRPLARWLWEQIFWRDGRFVSENQSLPAAILWAPEPLERGKLVRREAGLPLSGWADSRGLVASRTGYGAEDALFTIHAQQYTDFKHDQADKGQFTFYAWGDDLVIDSGYGNDSSKEKSTSGFAHNQVLIDGQPQLQGGAHSRTDGWITGALFTPVVDLAMADVADAYRYAYKSNFKDATYEKDFRQTVERATRQTVFVRGPIAYAVIFDEVRKDDAPHEYGWMLHARSGKAFEIRGNDIAVRAATAVQPVVATQPWEEPGAASTPGGAWAGTMQVPEAGKYVVWGLTGTDNPDGNKSDSFFLKLNGGKMGYVSGKDPARFAWTTFNRKPLAWVPLNDGEIKTGALDIPAGPLKVEVGVREPGAWFASLALLPEGKVPADDNTLPAEALSLKASEGEVRGAMRLVQLPESGGNAWLQAVVLAPSLFESRVEPFQTTREGSHPRLTLLAREPVGRFLTLLIPHRGGEEGLPVQQVKAGRGSVGVVKTTRGGEDLIGCWDGTGIQAGDVETDAEFLWLRRDGDGRVSALAATNASHLKVAGEPVFTVSPGRQSIAVGDGQAVTTGDHEQVRFSLPGLQVSSMKQPSAWMARREINGSR